MFYNNNLFKLNFSAFLMVWPFERRKECDYSGACKNYDEEVCTKTPSKSSFVNKKPKCYNPLEEAVVVKTKPEAKEKKPGLLAQILGIQ